MNPTLASTLDLIAKTGWRIFPTLLIPRNDGRIDKRPAIKNWPNECTSDPAQIERWWRTWPSAVPSLVTGPRNGVIVLDVDIGTDPRTGQAYSGFDSLENVFRWTESPPTPCVHTRRGGCHFYFACDRLPDSDVLNDRHPAHKDAIKNSVSMLAPHIDVRGWNGQVVLPAEGTGYTIDPALNFSVPMMRAMKWLNWRPRKKFDAENHQRTRFDPQAVLSDACQQIRHAPEGTRHDTFRHQTFKIARLVGLGLIDRQRAYFDLQAECMALGQIADGTTRRVEKYFEAAWNEGLAAAREQRR